MNTNSKSSAAGVGLYISEKLDYFLRRNWTTTKKAKEYYSCYCIRTSLERSWFVFGTLKTQLEGLNNKGHEIFISGDININFLKYNDDIYTSNYLDMLLDLGFMPLITKATRITYHSPTLIDHIYSNIPEKKTIKAGICLADVSDHFTYFLYHNKQAPRHHWN